MLSSLKVTSSLSSNSRILAAGLLLMLSSGSSAQKVAAPVYNPAVDISAKVSHGRKIAEFNYMQPLLSGDDYLPFLDLKIKVDNYSSKEVNIGLAYRRNFDDQFILGTYAYLDHRNTGDDLSVSGVTVGTEFLSKYFDARANIYVPQEKKKQLPHNKKALEISGNSIYLLTEGNTYEASYKGYDVEIGAPLFGFSEELNEKFGTKVYAGRYSFVAKGAKPINGTRFRLTHTLLDYYCCQDSYNLYLTAETQSDNVRKRQNFVGIGLKVSFNDRKNRYRRKPGSLSHRMMDQIVRDVDIVTNPSNAPQNRQTLYQDGAHNNAHGVIEVDSNMEFANGGMTEAEAMATFPEIFVAGATETIGGVAVYKGLRTQKGARVRHTIAVKNGHVVVSDIETIREFNRLRVAARGIQALTRLQGLARVRHARQDLQRLRNANVMLAGIRARQEAAARGIQALTRLQGLARVRHARQVADGLRDERDQAVAANNIQGAFRGYRARQVANGLRREQAALKLQTFRRMFIEQRRFAKDVKGVTTVQSLARGWLASKAYKDKQTKITLMQSTVRSFLARKKFEAAQKATTKIQAWVRGNKGRKEATEARARLEAEARVRLEATTNIQARVRGWLNSKAYNKQKESALKMQSVARMYVEKRRFAKVVENIKATKIQAWVRGNKGRKKAQAAAERLRREQAVTRLQVWGRVINARQVADGLRRERAALKLQTFRRMFIEQRRFAKAKKATAKIQSVARMYLAKKQFKAAQKVVTTVQSLARTWSARKAYNKKKESATQLQSAIRMFVEKRRFAKAQRQIGLMQRMTRGFLARNHQDKQVANATKIQACFRDYKARQAEAARLEAERVRLEATTNIQRLFRGYQGRQAAAEAKARLDVATNLQRLFRGWSASKAYNKKKVATTKIQSWFRDYRVRKAADERLRATIRLQALARVINSRQVADGLRREQAVAAVNQIVLGSTVAGKLEKIYTSLDAIKKYQVVAFRGVAFGTTDKITIDLGGEAEVSLKAAANNGKKANFLRELETLSNILDGFLDSYQVVRYKILAVKNVGLLREDGFSNFVNNVSQLKDIIRSHSHVARQPNITKQEALTLKSLERDLPQLERHLNSLGARSKQEKVLAPAFKPAADRAEARSLSRSRKGVAAEDGRSLSRTSSRKGEASSSRSSSASSRASSGSKGSR